MADISKRFLLAVVMIAAMVLTISCGLTGEVTSDEPPSLSSDARQSGSSSSSMGGSSLSVGGSSSSVSYGSSSSGGGGYTGSYGTVIDGDGQSYRTVVIGTQTWMAENLNYAVEGSKCYEDDESNCDTYGRLYNWETDMNICPDGWHLPSDAEWQTLIDFAGGSETAGGKLKAKSDWNSYNGISGNGTDEFGFSALPGGHGISDGSFINVGYFGGWWSSSVLNSSYAYGRVMYYYNNGVIRYGGNKSDLYSVRCLQDHDWGASATANSESSITVSWRSVTGATEYYIYRSTTADGTYSQIGSSATTSYADIGLSSGITYYYKAASYNSGETSIQSSYASASTFLPAVSTCDGMAGSTVTIGSQTWMKKNLNCNVGGSKCYDNNSTNCNTYGRLYNWATAMNLPSSCNSNSCKVQFPHKGICPSGWHLPSNEEWQTLIYFAGGSIAGKKLKATSDWNSYNGVSGNGTDEHGFSALPGGIGYSDGSFRDVGNYGSWWSASEYASSIAYYRYMYDRSEDAYWNNDDKSYLFSVRCLQD